MSPNQLRKVCDTCGTEFISSKFHPYIRSCKKCRKQAKKEGKPVIKPKEKKVVVDDTSANEEKDAIKEERIQAYMERSKIVDYLRIYKKLDMGFDVRILEAPDAVGKHWRVRISELIKEGWVINQKDGFLYLISEPNKS